MQEHCEQLDRDQSWQPGICEYLIATGQLIFDYFEYYVPEFWPKYRRIRRLYHRQPAESIRLCIDEFGPLNLLPRHGMHHARTGHVDRLRATYRRTGGVRHFMGVYDLERNMLTGRFVGKKNRRSFLSFLRWVRRRYRHRGTLHIVLDNASFHRCAEILDSARSHGIRFYWTPTGASWLNRIECQFTAMKKFTLDNTDYQSHDQMQAAIGSSLARRNRQRPISRNPGLPPDGAAPHGLDHGRETVKLEMALEPCQSQFLPLLAPRSHTEPSPGRSELAPSILSCT